MAATGPVPAPVRPSALPSGATVASLGLRWPGSWGEGMGRGRAGLFAVVLLLASCTDAGEPSSSSSASPQPGGTLRLAIVGDLRWGAELDPQKTYWGSEFELFRCCLLRTLYSYPGLPGGEGGAVARPDLAAGPPSVSPDGLMWTIPVREGIAYAPPLADVEVSAQDLVGALTFLLNTWLGAAIGIAMYVGARRYAPAEEAALAETFGPAWDDYAARVMLPWL